ncbi:MAG: DEAD/DEAH box helicase, partial [Phycisphaerales bacterium]|nr:DEAD/DEAH box helicase [Phycisphaerales bacterium]
MKPAGGAGRLKPVPASPGRGSGSAGPTGRGSEGDHPLSRPVQFVRGVGPYRAKILADLGLHTLGDLIEHFPFRYEEQLPPQRIDSLILNEPATVIGVVEQVRWRGGPGQATVNVLLRDGSGAARVTWFNAGHLRDKLERGQLLRLHGSVGEFEGLAQFANPRVEWLDADADPKSWHYARLLPVYAGTGELPSAQMARLVAAALTEGLPAVAEPLPEELRGRLGFASRAEAIREMHAPQVVADCERGGRIWRRLAFEELFLSQLAVTLTRRWSSSRGRSPKLPVTEEIDRRIRARFPFALTKAQDRVVREICADMALDKPMSRLLQGDVGSGKTVVALYAALTAIANRRQCVILAPTEVLASQHYASMEKYLAGSRVHRCLLTGNTSKAERDR